MKLKIIITIAILALVGGFLGLKASLGYKPDRIVIKPKTIQDYFDSAYNEGMVSIGFTSTPAATVYKYNKARDFWNKKYGLLFIGDTEMTKFLNDNDFILGQADRFIKNVPANVGKSIVANYNLTKDYAIAYTLTTTHPDVQYFLTESGVIYPKRNIDVMGSSFYEVAQIIKQDAFQKYGIQNSSWFNIVYNKPSVLVVAAAKDFNLTASTLINRILSRPAPDDPIAFIKVADGYVQLAQW